MLKLATNVQHMGSELSRQKHASDSQKNVLETPEKTLTQVRDGAGTAWAS